MSLRKEKGKAPGEAGPLTPFSFTSMIASHLTFRCESTLSSRLLSPKLYIKSEKTPQDNHDSYSILGLDVHGGHAIGCDGEVAWHTQHSHRRRQDVLTEKQLRGPVLTPNHVSYSRHCGIRFFPWHNPIRLYTISQLSRNKAVAFWRICFFFATPYLYICTPEARGSWSLPALSNTYYLHLQHNSPPT
jgi:hypothetical protein